MPIENAYGILSTMVYCSTSILFENEMFRMIRRFEQMETFLYQFLCIVSTPEKKKRFPKTATIQTIQKRNDSNRRTFGFYSGMQILDSIGYHMFAIRDFLS